MARIARALAPAVALFLVLPGCGYRLAGRGALRADVVVPTLANDSLEPGVELVLAAALRRELDRTGRFRVVESATDAAYAIRGRVAAVETLGRTFTPGVRALEFTLTVQLDLAVSGPGGRPIAIDPFAQRAADIYLASTDIEISRKNRAEALRRLAGMLAARIRRELEREIDRTRVAPGEDGRAAGPGPGGSERTERGWG